MPGQHRRELAYTQNGLTYRKAEATLLPPGWAAALPAPLAPLTQMDEQGVSGMETSHLRFVCDPFRGTNQLRSSWSQTPGSFASASVGGFALAHLFIGSRIDLSFQTGCYHEYASCGVSLRRDSVVFYCRTFRTSTCKEA